MIKTNNPQETSDYVAKNGMSIGEVYVTDCGRLCRERFSNRPANFILVHNTSDQVIHLKLNASNNQKYPIPAVNGVLGFDRNDWKKMSDIQLVNDSGAAATGYIYITYEWIYKDWIGDVDQ